MDTSRSMNFVCVSVPGIPIDPQLLQSNFSSYVYQDGHIQCRFPVLDVQYGH
jgi:hypothetical protein